jgi:hypothetical protein
LYRASGDIGSGHREGADIVRWFVMMGIVEMGVPGVRLRHVKTG